MSRSRTDGPTDEYVLGSEAERGLYSAGGLFMISVQLKEAARALGTNRRVLYFRGRVAPVGDVTAQAAHGLLAIFPWETVEATWAQTSDLSPQAALEAFAAADAAWGAEYLAGVENAPEISRIAEQVVDSTDLTTLLLTQAWAAQPRPQEPAARLAHALFLLRELRGGLHFCALRALGLTPIEATLVDPSAGAERLLRTGWPSDQVTALQQQVASNPELGSRRAEAEALTDDAFSRSLAVLTPADAELLRTSLVELGRQLPDIRS